MDFFKKSVSFGDKPEVEQFIKSLLSGRLDEVTSYIKDNAEFDIDTKDKNARTAFHHSVENSLFEMQHFLSWLGADVNEWIRTHELGWTTALEIALTSGDLQSIRTILEAPAFEVDKHTGIWVGIPKTAVLGYQHDETIKELDRNHHIDELKLEHDKTPGRLFLLAFNQDLEEFFDGNTLSGHISSIVSFRCDNHPTMDKIVSFTQPIFLTSIYAVGCDISTLDDWSSILRCVNLEVLVLSDNEISDLPLHIFKLEKLKTLKVDRNKLTQIPDRLSDLVSLSSFSCDFNNIVGMPSSIDRLANLQYLSCSNNIITHIEWLFYCKKLKVFLCSNNDVTDIPAGIDETSLPDLRVLDISYNKVPEIPPTMLGLIEQLTVFKFYSNVLEQKKILGKRKSMVDSLVLRRRSLRSSVEIETKIANIVYLGSKASGKNLLVKALSCKNGWGRDSVKPELPFTITQSTWKNPENPVEDAYHVSNFLLRADYLDEFSRGIAKANLYVVPIAIHKLSSSAKDGGNSSQLDSLPLWLNAIADVMQTTDRREPILIVGTHADLVQSRVRLRSIWIRMKTFLLVSRAKHVNSHSYHADCLICNADKGLTRKVHKDANGMGGLVLNWANDKNHPDLVVDDVDDENLFSNISNCDSLIIPHIVGYHEVSSWEEYPKVRSPFKPKIKGEIVDNWSTDMVIHHLLRQLKMFTKCATIAKNWVEVGKYFQELAKDHARLPARCVEDIKYALRHIFAIPEDSMEHLLRHFHQRGIVLYFSDSEVLSNVVILNPAWFSAKLKEIPKRLQRDGATFKINDLESRLYDDDLARIFEGTATHSTTYEWLLAALLKFQVCIPIPYQNPQQPMTVYFPDLLPRGVPDWHAWPDSPEQSQRHLAYEVKLSRISPTMFQDLILCFLTVGQKELKFVTDPHPFLLRSDVVFFSEAKPTCCDICKAPEDEKCPNMGRHRVRIQLIPYVDVVRVSVRGNKPCCLMKLMVPFVNKNLDSFIEGKGYESWSFLCPQCVIAHEKKLHRFPMTRLIDPEQRKFIEPICDNWHDIGSWQSALCGTAAVYNTFKITKELIQATGDMEHPKLFVLLRDDVQSSFQNWIMFSKLGFLDGYTLHLLCECPNNWHFTDSPGYDLQRPKEDKKEFLQTASKVLKVASTVSNVFLKISTGAMTGPVPQLASMMASSTAMQSATSAAGSTKDIAKGLSNYTDKMLGDFSSKYKDLNFKVSSSDTGNTIEEVMTSSSLSRRELARFFKENDGDGRFGSLSPLFVNNSVKWLCEEHHQLFKGVNP